MCHHVRVVTDGSAIGNPGPGGWAAIFTCGKRRWHLSGAVSFTTINEMELTAAIEALRSLDAGSHVTLCSDSEYLIRGMRYLANRCIQQGWRNSRGLPMQDKALWLTLLDLAHRHTVQWQWVRGHRGHSIQTEADSLAHKEARQLQLAMRMAA